MRKNVRFAVCLLVLCLIAQPLGAKDRQSVAVLPFSLISPDNIDYLRQGVLNMIASRLSINEKIEVISRDQVIATLPDGQGKDFSAAELSALGKKLNADFLVWGSITKIGNALSIDGKLFDAAAGKGAFSVVAQCQGMDEVIPKINDLSQRIELQITGGSPLPVASQPQNREFIVSRTPQTAAQSAREAEIISGMKSGKRGTLTSMINPDFINTDIPLNRETVWRSAQLPFEIRGMDIGDVNGDGLNETVIIDVNNIYIYQRKGQNFTLLHQVKGSAYANYLGVDLADVNGNGTKEIIVTNYYNQMVDSLIVEYRDGKYQTIASGLKWFFRAVDKGDGIPLLLGQQQGYKYMFENSIYEIVWRDGRYQEGRRMQIPQGLPIFGTTITKLTPNGRDMVVALDPDDYLRVFDLTDKPLSQIVTFGGSNELLWKSEEPFGGSNTYVEAKDLYAQADIPGAVRKSYINVRIVAFDTNKDGKREIIIVKNGGNSASRLFQEARFFSSAEVFDLEWDNMGMVENWRTKKINGFIPDYQFKDIDNDGQNEVVLSVVVAVAGSLRSRSILIAYEMN